MYKAVFFDIDGTIISKKDNSIPKSFYQAIQQLKEKNILCGIATGRHPIELQQEGLLDNIDFDIYVMLNGALCLENQKVIYSKKINPQTIQEMITISNTQKLPLLFVEENDMYLNFIDDSVIKAQNAIHTAIPPVKDIHLNQPIYQMCLFCTPEQKQQFEAFTDLNITRWHELSYDIIDKNTSKINGIQKSLETHQIKLDEVLCFGDGDNDVSMFEGCGYAIALKDCSELARKAANEITDSVENDGIYKALKKLQII